MSKKTYEEYIKNGCCPVGYNEPCQSYLFGQTSVDLLLDRIDQLKQQLEDLKSKLREANRVKNKNKFLEEKNKEKREKNDQLLKEIMASNSKLNLENAVLKQQLEEEKEKVNGILTDIIIEVTKDEFDLDRLCYLEEVSAKFYEKIQEKIKELRLL